MKNLEKWSEPAFQNSEINKTLHRKNKKYIENIFEEAQIFDLPGNDSKWAILNMFKELKEAMFKELNESIEMLFYHIKNIN